MLFSRWSRLVVGSHRVGLGGRGESVCRTNSCPELGGGTTGGSRPVAWGQKRHRKGICSSLKQPLDRHTDVSGTPRLTRNYSARQIVRGNGLPYSSLSVARNLDLLKRFIRNGYHFSNRKGPNQWGSPSRTTALDKRSEGPKRQTKNRLRCGPLTLPSDSPRSSESRRWPWDTLQHLSCRPNNKKGNVITYGGMASLINFMLTGENVETTRRVLMVEQLSAVIRYVVLRSMKALLVAGLCSTNPAARFADFGGTRRKSQEELSSGSVTQRVLTQDDRKPSVTTMDLLEEGEAFPSSPRLCSIREEMPFQNTGDGAPGRSSRRKSTMGDSSGSRRAPMALNSRPSGRLLSSSLFQQCSVSEGACLGDVTARGIDAESSDMISREVSCTTASSDAGNTGQQIGRSQGFQWALLVELLLPSADSRRRGHSNKHPLSIAPSSTARRYAGWLLLRMLHSLGISLLGAKPAFHAALQDEGKEKGNEGSEAFYHTSRSKTAFWKSQPLADALQASLSEIVKAAFEWHMQRNIPLMASLVLPQAPDIFVVHPTDFCWMESVLRFLTLHVCLNTEPLDQTDSVVLFLQHLLTLAHPVPLRLFAKEGPTSRIFSNAFTARVDTEEATAGDCHRGASVDSLAAAVSFQRGSPFRPLRGLVPSSSYETLTTGGSPRACFVPLATAVTKVIIRCFGPRRWASDGSPTQCGFRLHEKATVAGCTTMVYVQRKKLADPFTPPLKAIRNMSITQSGAGEIVGPLRDPRTGAGHLTFTFSGPTAGEPDGTEEAIVDVRLQLQAVGEIHDRVRPALTPPCSLLQRQGFSLEKSFSVTPGLKARLWVRKGLLVYDAPNVEAEGADGRTDAQLRSPRRSDSGPCALPSPQLLLSGSRPKLPSANLAGPGMECSTWQDEFSSRHTDGGDLESKAKLLLARQYEGASQKLQQSAWRAFQAALWFLLVAPEEGNTRRTNSAGQQGSAPAKANKPVRYTEEAHQDPRAGVNELSFRSTHNPQGNMRREAIAVEALKMTFCTMQRLVELQEQTIRGIYRSNSLGLRSGNQGPSLFRSQSWGLSNRGARNSKDDEGVSDVAAAASHGISRSSSLSEGEAVATEEESGSYSAPQIPEKVFLTERLIERILVILLRCVLESEEAAGLFMKTLLVYYKTLPAQLETVLRTLSVKACLYRLLTECVRRMADARGVEDYVASLSSVEPRDFMGPQRSSSKERADLGNWLFPSLQPITVGSLLESSGSLLQRHMETAEERTQQQEKQEVAEASDPFRSQESGSAPPGPASMEQQLPVEVAPLQQYEITEQFSGMGDPALSFTSPSPGPSSSPSAPMGGLVRGRTDSLFDALPQSDFFLCAQPSEDFEAQVLIRTLHVTRANNLGGVVLCRAPLTFPALNVEPGEAEDVIGFRLLSSGRFGVTVAPADCVLSAAQDIFDRNDVVGFRTNTCPPFWEDVFATNVLYQPGDYLSVKFSVDDQPNGQRCLHTELHVSGESIGSVLEVFYEQASQVEQARRMNLVFVFQDPLAIVYGGPAFTLQYVDPDLARLYSRHQAGEKEGENGNVSQPPTQQVLRWHRLHPLFQQSLQMYQAVLLAPEEALMGERGKVLGQLCDYLKTAASSLGVAFEALCAKYAECSPKGNEADCGDLGDSAQGSTNLKRRGNLPSSLVSGSLFDGSSKLPEYARSGSLKEPVTEIRRDISTGLRPCSFRPQQRTSREEHETLRACRRGIAALAVVCCDCKGKGELQNLLAIAEKPSGTGGNDPDASCCANHTGDPHDGSDASQSNLGLGLPWLVGSSSLPLSAVVGLGRMELESLLIALTDLLTSPVIQGTLHQVAVVGHLVAPSQDWEVVQAVAVTLGSKAIVALCLVLRALLQLRPDGHPPLSERAQQGIEKVFGFLEQFCFLISGLKPRQIDPLADNLKGLDDTHRDLINSPSQSQPSTTPSSKALNYRSASVPDLRRAIAAYSGTDSAPTKTIPARDPSPDPDVPRTTPQENLRLDMMARLCGVPASILSSEGLECPEVAEQTVLAAADTPKVWRWIFKVNEAWHDAAQEALRDSKNAAGSSVSALHECIRRDGGTAPSAGVGAGQVPFEELVGLGADCAAASLFLLKPRQNEGYMHFRGPVDVRVFSYEGECSHWSRRMVHRLVETPLRWAVRRDALHLVCTIAALFPGLILSRLYGAIRESMKTRASGDPRRGAPSPDALNIIRLFRICAYFVSRETDDNAPDYQQPFRLHLDTEPTEELLRELDRYSVVFDPLYGWQRVFYTAATKWTDAAFLEILHRLIQTELLYHLMGSVGQVVSKVNPSKESPKYCPLAPSVYVAHWLMDGFVRHPLCPGSIRQALVYPLSYSSLFSLLINGSSLPLKLGLDAARMTHWMLARFVPDTPSADFSVADGFSAVISGNNRLKQGTEITQQSAVCTDGFKGSPMAPSKRSKTAMAEVAGVAVKGPNRQFLGFLQCYFDCVCFIGASVFDNLEKANNWRASTLDCFSGADRSRIHVRYRINCSLLAHYLANACVSILKADRWGSVTWMELSSIPILADLVSYLMAAESVASSCCFTTWAATAGASTPSAGSERRFYEALSGFTRCNGSYEETCSGDSRSPAQVVGDSDEVRVGFSPAFIRAVQTLPVPVSFSEPITSTLSVGRVEALPGVKLELDLEPIDSKQPELLRGSPFERPPCWTREEQLVCPRDARELRKFPRLLVALDRSMEHLVGESSNSMRVPEWQRVFVNGSRTGKDALHMESKRLDSSNTGCNELRSLMVSNLHAPTLGRSYACSSLSLQCGSSSASCGITFALQSTSGNVSSDFGIKKDGAPLCRILIGAVDGTHRRQVLEGMWDGTSHASFLHLATRDLTSSFDSGLSRRQWAAVHDQRTAKRRALLANLLVEERATEEGATSERSEDSTSVAINGLSFVITAVGRHLLWFSEGQLVAAQMLPPSCTEVLPVVVICEASETCASPDVSALWRTLILTATLTPASRQPISVSSNDVFYCLEPAPADCPVKLLRASSGLPSKSEGLATGGCQSFSLGTEIEGRTGAEMLEEQAETQNGSSRPSFSDFPCGHYTLSGATTAGISLNPQWRLSVLSVKIRSGVSARLPLGVPTAYSPTTWKWLHRPGSSQTLSEDGLMEAEQGDSEADANAGRAVASTGHWGSDHSDFSDPLQVSGGTAFGDLASCGGSTVFLAPAYAPPTGAGGPSGAVTRAVLSPPSLLGSRSTRTTSIPTANLHTAAPSRCSRQHSLPSGSLWVSPDATPSLGNVHPALPFRVQFRGGSRAGGEAGVNVVGIIWGCCRWLWFSNGRLLCPLDLPVAELMRQHAEAASSNSSSGMRAAHEGWREVYVTKGVTAFSPRDLVEIEFQPAIPALLFKRNEVYQFGLNFDKFYQWTPGRTTRSHQQQATTTPSEKDREMVFFPSQRFRSTELISTETAAISRNTTSPGPLVTQQHVEMHQGAVQALFVAIKDRNLRWLLNYFSYYPDWLEEQDAAAMPGSCTFASLEQRLSGGLNGNGPQWQSQQQQHLGVFGEHESDTPLKLAVKKGYLDVVQLLIEEAGCNPDGVGDGSERITPLMLAAELGHHAIVATLVCIYGVNTNRRDADGNSALHRVVLRAAGFPVTGIRISTSSAAHRRGYYSTVKLLLSLGADCTLKNDAGLSPVDIISSRGEAAQEGANAIERLLRYHAVIAQTQLASIQPEPLRRRGHSPFKGTSGCVAFKWGSLLANCSVIVGGSDDCTPVLHSLYIDGERRDDTALSSHITGDAAAENGAIFSTPVAPPPPQQQQLSSFCQLDACDEDSQVQLEMKKVSELKATSSSLAGSMEDSAELSAGWFGARASRRSTSLIASTSATAGGHRWLATASSATEPAEASVIWTCASAAPSSCSVPSILRTRGQPLPIAAEDVRTLLQQLLVSGLDLFGDADPLPRSENQPVPLRPPMTAASGSLLRNVTWAEDFPLLQSVILTIIRRLIELEEQQRSQQTQSAGLPQQSASPQAARTVHAVTRKFDGGRSRHNRGEQSPVPSSFIRNNLQRLAVCAENAATIEGLVGLLLPLELLAGRLESSTRRGWVEGVQREAWRQRVARDLGYQIALGGPGGLVWTPDVQLLAEATGEDLQRPLLGLQEQGSTGEGCGLLVVRAVLDFDDMVVHSALRSWPLKMDIWLRQLLDAFDGVEEGKTISQAEKHLRIAALVWKADGDREELLSFYRYCCLPIGKHDSLQEVEQALSLKEAIIALINEASPVAPRSSMELLSQHIIGVRLRLLEHISACATRAVPVISPIFNIPKLPLDYYGLLTAHSGSSFFQGTFSSFLGDWEARASHSYRKLKRSRSYNKSKMVLQVGPSDLPIEMSSYLFVRPLLRIATTNALWNHIIDKLGYSSHEQPSIRLDRGQAATAKSLVHTLWYQATTQLLSASARPCRLRARIGDRPFMVVFRGEGATDFGGPFQEFLSGVANEVMGPLAESPNELLPTFFACLPCLNSTHAIGPHQDSVLLRPDLCGPAPDPLVSSATLQQRRRIHEDDSGKPSPLLRGRSRSCTDVLQVEEAEEYNELCHLHECGEAMRITTEERTIQRPTLYGDRSCSLQSQLGRLMQVNTLWTPNTISSFLPAASSGIPARSSRSEEPRDLGQHTQEDPLGIAASRQDRVSGGTPPTGPPSALLGADEEMLSEEAIQLLMYEALGRLMAMCFCIGSAFNVKFNPMLWKKLVAAPLSIDDLADSDCVAVEMIRSLRRMAAVPPEFWDSTMEASLSDMTFSTEDTLGRSFELVKGGADIPVDAFNLVTFIRLSERFRLLEGTEGVEAVLRGIAAVLPLGRLRLLFEWRRLEYRVCGDREVDVATLKERTVCTSERLKAELFQILESFNNEQMQRFLRFVCGRSRLPVASTDWRMTVDFETPNQRLPVHNDNRLPTAATCSFRLLMPRYSSTAIMRQRLMYAISNCTAIDLDAYVVHEQMQLMYDS